MAVFNICLHLAIYQKKTLTKAINTILNNANNQIKASSSKGYSKYKYMSATVSTPTKDPKIISFFLGLCFLSKSIPTT